MKQKFLNDSPPRSSPFRRSIDFKQAKEVMMDHRKSSLGRHFPRTEIVRDQNNNVFLNSSDFPRLFKYLSATGNSVKVTDRDVQRKLPYLSGEKVLLTPPSISPDYAREKSPRHTKTFKVDHGLQLTIKSKGELSLQEMEELLSKQKDYQDKVKVSMRQIFERFFMDETSDKQDVVSLKKVAKLLSELGITTVDPADYQILQEVLDKDKDGVVSFRDLLNLVPQARLSMSVPASNGGSTVYNPSLERRKFSNQLTRSITPTKRPNDVFLLDDAKFNKLKDTVLK